MKQGWLVVNSYLNTDKFNEIYDWLVRAAEKRGISLRVIPGDMIASVVDLSKISQDWKVKPDFVIFWDKDVKLAKALESEGFKLFNSADAVEVCDDKALTFIRLKNSGISMPRTYLAPLSFTGEFDDYAFLLMAGKTLGYPLIIKENKGSFGAQVYKADTYEEGVSIIQEIGSSDFIIQEFVESSNGRDVRLQVVGGKVVCAMKRTNDEDFRANVTNGGSMEKYTPSKEQAELALKVCDKLGLDFAGVDILFGEDDLPILCEVNSNAHFKNICDCTGVNTADCIMEYIDEKIYKD